MNNTAGRWLIPYGILIVALGFAAVLYDPSTGVIGFNAKAKSGLISGGICGGLAVVWGLLARSGRRWALGAALGTTLLFLAAFAARGVIGWSALLHGVSGRGYAVGLITIMTLATAALVFFLIRDLRRR